MLRGSSCLLFCAQIWVSSLTSDPRRETRCCNIPQGPAFLDIRCVAMPRVVIAQPMFCHWPWWGPARIEAACHCMGSKVPARVLVYQRLLTGETPKKHPGGQQSAKSWYKDRVSDILQLRISPGTATNLCEPSLYTHHYNISGLLVGRNLSYN